MAGKVIRVQGPTDLPTTFPRFYDGGPTVTPGHLAYIDFTHSLDTLQGVPSAGMVIRNLARKEAARLCGQTAAQLGNLDWSFALGSGTASSQFLMERTPKGGLHMIVSQSAGNANTWAAVQAPEAIRAYIAANPDNRYLMAMAARITRDSVNDSLSNQLRLATSEVVSSGLENLRIGQRSIRGTEFEGDTSPFLNLDTEDLVIVSGNTWTADSKPANAAASVLQFGAGLVSPALRASGYHNKAASLVWRFFHFVDVTAATAAGVTLDQITQGIRADFDRAVATGGRFNGDTVPTTPAI